MLFPFFRHHGVLGLNARNLLYLRPFNPEKAVAFADNKLKTKAYLSARGVPVARIYARIEDRKQLQDFDFATLPQECVLKPNFGFGGEGILILKGKRNGEFLEQGKYPIPEEQLREHIEDILDGKFSVNGKKDTAFFEKILVPHRGFAPFRPAGLPDLRFVVFNLVPVMAMLRIPTAQSRGKANVHQGGIGIGIDIAKGVTTHAFQYHNLIKELPHGGSPSGIAIPYWEEMLLVSSRIQQVTNIGYLAVDLTLDEEQGPVLLEVNARAGLSVQIANLAPLRSRLERVRGLSVSSPEKGVRIAQDLFGEKVDRGSKARQALEKPVLGNRENILINCAGGSVEVPCLIAPVLTDRTLFTPDLLEELEERGGATRADDGTYHVKFSLGGKKIQTLVRTGSAPFMSVRAVIGQRDLTGFLIDPMKTVTSSLVRSQLKVDLRAFDKVLAQTDQDLLLLKYLKPINLYEERARLEEDQEYSPFFLYPEIPLDMGDVEKRLMSFLTDDSPLGVLLAKKRREMLERIAVLRARGDTKKFMAASIELFGEPRESLLDEAKAVLASRIACDLPPPRKSLLPADKAASIFEEALSRYGLHDWQVSVRGALVADCTVGWKHLYLREGALFSPEHVSSLLAHEVETHILTVENGNHQPYEIFRRGFANYLDTQEGLAVFNQNRILSLYHEKRYGPARGVLAVAYAMTHPFVETRQYLEAELGYNHAKALTKVIELKRGLHDTSELGSFTKGLVYFRGLRNIEKFVNEGGDLKRLYIGKIALEDLEQAEEVPGVQLPLLLPAFLRGK